MIRMRIALSLMMVAVVALMAARQGRNWTAWSIFTAAFGNLGFLAILITVLRRPRPVVALGIRGAALRLLGGLAIGAVAIIVLTWFTMAVAQTARIEGKAMEPTLVNGTVVIVNKLAYVDADPRRGDVVMLLYPINPDKIFVKRIIAEEGDTIRIRDGRVFVNDIPRTDDQVAPEGRSHDDFGPQMVPEGYCFVMGDRRNNSSDSRHWGMVPKKYVLGRVAFRLFGPGWLTFVK
jgi:signal peptidase I